MLKLSNNILHPSDLAHNVTFLKNLLEWFNNEPWTCEAHVIQLLGMLSKVRTAALSRCLEVSVHVCLTMPNLPIGHTLAMNTEGLLQYGNHTHPLLQKPCSPIRFQIDDIYFILVGIGLVV